MFIPITNGGFFLLFKEEKDGLSSITGAYDYKMCKEIPCDLYCKMINMAVEKTKQLKLIDE